MKRHRAYLSYVLRHKYFVWIAGARLGVPVWRLLVHDWTKFLPGEWSPYAETFYEDDGSSRYLETPAFAVAWNHHQKRNSHHWQYWLLTWDIGETEPLEMPQADLLEMLADWAGAGRAATGQWGGIRLWYKQNRSRIILHPKTRKTVESLLAEWAL